MKNKRGFTLVELLAVIIVLALVLIIAVPSVNKYMKNSKEKAYQVQMSTILEALESYANSYKKVLPQNTGEEVTVTLGQLKAEGLIENEFKDPKSDKYFEDSMELKIRRVGKNFIYEVDETTVKTRKSEEKSPTLILTGNIVEYYNIGDTYKEAGYVAYDYEGNEIPNISTNIEELNLDTTGIFKIKYVATDYNGVSTVAIRNIIVGIAGIRYSDGEIVYFNPTTGTKCTESQAVSTTGTKSGCMKWRAFLDNGSSDTVKLLLDHNTTDTIIWNSNQASTNPNEIMVQLAADTTGWKQVINGSDTPLTVRLLTFEELVGIAPPLTTLNKNDYLSYVLHNGKVFAEEELAEDPFELLHTGEAGTNRYAWLFDNTEECEMFGCNKSDSGTWGYWTGSYCGDFADIGKTAWVMTAFGLAAPGPTNLYNEEDQKVGIRPVIELNKIVLQ